jgi:hypothetical protein
MLAAVLIAWALAPALALTPCFDRILLKDGRIIEGDLLPAKDAATTLLSISGIEVPVRNDLIAKTFSENLANYKPKNTQEEEYLKKGFVLFEGNWMSASRRDQELKKRADADKAAVEDLKKRSNWKSATVTTSPHFEIKSNCDEDVVKDYSDRLEAFYKYFTSEWGVRVTPGNNRGKLTVDLHRGYDMITISKVGDTLVMSFDFDNGAISLVYDSADPESNRRDLYRSAAWQLTFHIAPNFYYPDWIQNGLSDYFATTQVDADGKFHFGAPDFGAYLEIVEAQDKGTMPPLRDIVISEDVDRKSIHASLEWALVHFLMESPKYSKAFKAFYVGLPNNPDAKVQQGVNWMRKGAAVNYSADADCLAALEKRLGVKLDQLEKELLASLKDMNSQLTAKAYWGAGERALWRAMRDDKEDKLTDDQRLELVKTAFVHMQHAADMGIEEAGFYRHYAEMLRKGGIKERDQTLKPRKPDPQAAWAMIQKSLQLDPLDPYAYTEAAGILILDGAVQDLDRAANMAAAGLKVGGGRNYGVKSLHDDLMALIEPARAKREAAAEAAVEEAKNDNRKWHVAFYYVKGQEPPANLANITTDELRQLIRSGKVTGRDSVYQSWQVNDPETGKPIVGDNPWDKDWVKVREATIFADELAAANAPKPPVAGEQPATQPVEPPNDPPANPPLPADGK